MKSGIVFQIDADKHSFELLGELRGLSDAVNIQKMCDLLENMNEHVIVDPYYEAFKPPSQSNRMRLPGPRIDQDTSPFPFYSRWAALMYRHLLSSV